MRRLWFVGFLVMIFLLMGACGQPQVVEETQGRGNQAGGKTEVNMDTGAASSKDEAKDATIYIEAAGGFFDEDVDRQFGELSYGSGSGFIIDEQGIAVTNNHVVTGASYLQVYLEGEEEPLRARILGVSECSDLAIIDIEGGSYPFVDWRNKQIESGLSVTAIGYPAEDVGGGELPDQTVTSGIINTVEANGDLPWASVESVIEHEAQIRPGNSGGPLVDSDGKVVGINFAGDDSERYLSVSRDETQTLSTDLRAGDITSIGVNGEAILQEDEGYSGIGVSSVKTGSPAFDVGIRGVEANQETDVYTQFDIITEIEGTRLAEDATMKTYCDVLRGHDPEDQLTIEVERYNYDDSGDLTDFAVLEGVLNGAELEENKDETEERIQQYGYDQTSSSASASASGYTEVVDETESLTMEVPSEWTDVQSGRWEPGGEDVGLAFAASTDVENYTKTYEESGAYMAASSELAQRYPDDTANQILDLSDYYDFSGACKYEDRYDYDDGAFVGSYDVWTNCDGTGNEFQVLAATPEDGSYAVLVQILVVGETGVGEVEQHILDTFNVLSAP